MWHDSVTRFPAVFGVSIRSDLTTWKCAKRWANYCLCYRCFATIKWNRVRNTWTCTVLFPVFWFLSALWCHCVLFDELFVSGLRGCITCESPLPPGYGCQFLSKKNYFTITILINSVRTVHSGIPSKRRHNSGCEYFIYCLIVIIFPNFQLSRQVFQI